MSDKNFASRKNRKTKWSFNGLRVFFCCISKSSSNLDKHKELVDVSCQCDAGNGNVIFESGEILRTEFSPKRILVESKAKLDVTIYKDTETSPLIDDFATSLVKLDSLINTLNTIRDCYKSNSALDSFDVNKPNWSRALKKDDDEEILKFNVNINENTCIQCHTKKGKHSLQIVDTNYETEKHNLKHFIVHRCESEFSVTTSRHDARKFTESFGENHLFRGKPPLQLQRSYAILRHNFGLFNSDIMKHISRIKSDVKSLKRLLFNVEYVAANAKESMFSFRYGDVRNLFSVSQDIRQVKSLVRMEDCKLIEAKIRAANFCKFYKLGKMYNKKSKNRNRRKHKSLYILQK